MTDTSPASYPMVLPLARVEKSGIIGKAILSLILLTMFGVFQRPLGGGQIEGSMTGVVIQNSNVLFQLFSLSLIGLIGLLALARLRFFTLPSGAIPSVLITGLAILSAGWSPLHGSTMSAAIALAGTTLMALYVYAYYSWMDFIQVLKGVAALLVWGTALLAIFAPSYAYHSTNEFFSMHAGLLRGFYSHKNSLGAMLSLSIIALYTLTPKVQRGWRFWATIFVGVWLISITGSAKSLVAVPMALFIPIVVLSAASGSARLSIILFSLCLIMALFISGLVGDMTAATLAALDRDPTMSGRTLIWQTAIDYTFKAGHWVFGGGYSTAWSAGLGEYSQQQIGFNAGHPHNGFIKLFIELGAVGLGLGILQLGVALFGALAVDGRLNKCAGSPQYFALGFIVLLVTNNFAASSFVKYLDIYWFLFVLLPAVTTWSNRDKK
ncbi:O-antigen ligase family protein [Yoonia maritima]|uniref:O-antigen ligase family protein n=1 Tax=Yoonia maritima TaxID=1435347 RepID=UPI000D0F46C7|nr:O-antigen ligase family protein [Yoonia maritima]